MAGLGFELAAAVLGFALLGYWIDRHFGTSPWGLLVAVLLGLVGGLYNFLRASLKALRAPSRPAEGRRADAPPRDDA